MSSPFVGPGGAPRRIIPPKPGPPPGGPRPALHARKHPPPPRLGADRDVDAVYILDSGVGLSFAHIADGMDLLADHYGSQLRYVEDVCVEWRSQAATQIRPLEPGQTPNHKAVRAQLVALKAAAARCLTEVPARFGVPVDLGYGELENVDALVAELCALPPARPNTGDDRGECASVRLAELLSGEARVVVLCSNDDRGRRLASRYGIAHRNARTVLREMVREGRLSAIDAFAYYQEMVNLSGIKEWARMTSPSNFL